MRNFVFFFLAALATSSLYAASYQRNDGTIIDPIQLLMEHGGGNRSYADISLKPDADLTDADLYNANMSWAWLSNANLTSANLSFASLYETNLSGAIFSYTKNWETASWSNSFYYINNVPTWASGMDPIALGILALEPPAVPEPSTVLLALLGPGFPATGLHLVAAVGDAADWQPQHQGHETGPGGSNSEQARAPRDHQR